MAVNFLFSKDLHMTQFWENLLYPIPAKAC
jgi:hypothetical protein